MTRETIKGWGEETSQPPPATPPKLVWLETTNQRNYHAVRRTAHDQCWSWRLAREVASYVDIPNGVFVAAVATLV